MKHVKSLAIIILTALLCSCHATEKSYSQTVSENTLGNEASISDSECTVSQTETHQETTVIVEYLPTSFPPYITLRNLEILLIRWGDIVPNSQYEQAVRRDSETGEILETRSMVAVRIEIEEVYIDTKGIYTGNENYYRRIWISADTLDRIKEGPSAIVIVTQHIFDVPDDQRPIMAGASEITAIGSYSNNKIVDNVIPVVDEKLNLQCPGGMQWSSIMDFFFLHNQWNEAESAGAPFFEDGMTLNEFETLVEYIRTY